MVERYGAGIWAERGARGTAVRDARAAAGTYRVGHSPTFAFALSAEQKSLLLATAAASGVSAAELCRACLTRALPQVVRVKKRAQGDQAALKRYAEKIVSDSRKAWVVDEPPEKPTG